MFTACIYVYTDLTFVYINMEIRPSRYYLPFTEYPVPGVHFIPKDYLRQMEAGLYDAHIALYRSLPSPAANLFEVYNPLTNETHIFNLDNDHYLAPYARNPVSRTISADDKKMLEESFYKFGVKAAGRALGLCK